MQWLRRGSALLKPRAASATDKGVVAAASPESVSADVPASPDACRSLSSHDSTNASATNGYPVRQGQPSPTLREVQATAAELWSTAADERGDEATASTVSSATEPLAQHPYYVPICMLNKGASGFVQLAPDMRTGQRFAIKFIPRGSGFDVKTISRELMNQRMCYGHPNIIQLKEVFLTSHHLGIAMEYADGGDLSQYIDEQSQQGIDGLPEDDARWLFQQLIVALDYCHRLGIANRDVKLDNMMLHGTWPSPVLKICDFGFSKDEAGQSVSKSTCGTPEYMAPEVLFERTYDGKAADMWSCGVSLYLMLTGFFPFARDSDDDCTNVVRMQRMFTRIIQGDYEPLAKVSEEGQDLMHRLLQPDPHKRLTMAQVMDHPWFQRNLPPPLMTLNARIVATSAHNAGIAGTTQSATELLSLVADGRAGRCMRSSSASPIEYQQQLAQLSTPPLPERANSQPAHDMELTPALQHQRLVPGTMLGHGPLPPHPADIIRAAEAMHSGEQLWAGQDSYFWSQAQQQHQQAAPYAGSLTEAARQHGGGGSRSHMHEADDMDIDDGALPAKQSSGRFSCKSL